MSIILDINCINAFLAHYNNLTIVIKRTPQVINPRGSLKFYI